MQQKIAEPLAKLDSEDESAAARENQENCVIRTCEK